MPGQEILGKRLGPLELRRGCARAETGQALFDEPVHDPGDERCFGPDNREVYLFCLCEFEQAVYIVRRHGNVADLVLARRAGVAGRNEHLMRRLCALPGERMLATTGTYNQDLHAGNDTVS
jgi:hypothetical protein